MIQQEILEESSCERDGCCSSTEDGSAICLPSQGSVAESKHSGAELPRWRRIRSGVMFGIACIASPCCAPLIIPIILFMMAGTPFALWLGQNLGWVYGGFTLLSVISFGLGFYWMRKDNNNTSQQKLVQLGDIPVIQTQFEESRHAD